MKLRLTKTPLEGLLVAEFDYFKDERGFLVEAWHQNDFAAAGITDEFVQENHSGSVAGVIRGMHYQDLNAPLVKLVRCTVGRILDVAIDLRASSPTFGKWFGVELSAENKQLVYIPVGFAHGYATLSDYCEVQYKQSGYYRPDSEGGIAWNDPEIGIEWPVEDPILSTRDQHLPSFREYRKRPAFK